MKKLQPVSIVVGILVAGGVLLVAAHYGADHYLTNSQKTAAQTATVHCSGQHSAYVVTIQNNQVTPRSTEAHLCDTLTITNNDAVTREMAFGEHVDHRAYDGVTEKSLGQGGTFTVTLNQAGSFTFHDHFQEDVIGDFTVTQ